MQLADLSNRVVSCQLCPRLRAHCMEVGRLRRRQFATELYWARPVPGFGDPQARLLIVGLAPAAHGGNRTGRIFTGDSSGDWLYDALHRFGWANQPVSRSRDDGLQLTDCYITAAARCAPPDNHPTREELDLCRRYLIAELELLPRVHIVLALGRIGWESWLRAAGWWRSPALTERLEFQHGRETILPDQTRLLASYHPSRQNTNTGRLTRPMWLGVFQRIRILVDESLPQPV